MINTDLNFDLNKVYALSKAKIDGEIKKRKQEEIANLNKGNQNPIAILFKKYIDLEQKYMATRSSKKTKSVKETFDTLFDKDYIYELEKSEIERRLNEEREHLYKELEEQRQNTQAKIESISVSKQQAEAEFPSALRDIKQSIKDAIADQEHETFYSVNCDVEGMYLSIMILEALSLQGFYCDPDGQDIRIEW
jgi:hypothetical protein